MDFDGMFAEAVFEDSSVADDLGFTYQTIEEIFSLAPLINDVEK